MRHPDLRSARGDASRNTAQILPGCTQRLRGNAVMQETRRQVRKLWRKDRPPEISANFEAGIPLPIREGLGGWVGGSSVCSPRPLLRPGQPHPGPPDAAVLPLGLAACQSSKPNHRACLLSACRSDPPSSNRHDGARSNGDEEHTPVAERSVLPDDSQCHRAPPGSPGSAVVNPARRSIFPPPERGVVPEEAEGIPGRGRAPRLLTLPEQGQSDAAARRPRIACCAAPPVREALPRPDCHSPVTSARIAVRMCSPSMRRQQMDHAGRRRAPPSVARCWRARPR